MCERAHRLALGLLLLVSACTGRRYAGPPRPAEQVAVIHVGNALVREFDGEKRRGGAFDFSHFEVEPGPHRLTLVFELTTRTLGSKDIPLQAGEGVCVLEFTAQPGKQYYLGSGPRGEWTTHWKGAWEGWVRDPTLASESDIVARCASQPAAEEASVEPPAAPTGAANGSNPLHSNPDIE